MPETHVDTTELTPPEEDQEAALQEAIQGWHDACDALEKWQAEKDAAAQAIMARLAPGQRVGGVTVQRGVMRFNPDAARRVLAPLGLLDAVVRPVPDAELARQVLKDLPELYASVCTQGRPFVKRAS